MFGYFKFQVWGTCTSDVEFTKLRNGQTRATINIAVNRPFKRDDGTWDQTATFVRLALFGKATERAELRRAKKGVTVSAEGDVSSYNVEQGDGKKITCFNFKPRTMGFGGKRERLEEGASMHDDEPLPDDDLPEAFS